MVLYLLHSPQNGLLSVPPSLPVGVSTFLCLCVFFALCSLSLYLCMALFLLFFFVSLVLYVTPISLPSLLDLHTTFNCLRGLSLPVLMKAPILFLTAQSGELRNV